MDELAAFLFLMCRVLGPYYSGVVAVAGIVSTAYVLVFRSQCCCKLCALPVSSVLVDS